MVVDVVDMLTKLGIRNIGVMGDEAKFSCPFPGHSHGDSNPSACMNLKTGAWICFGCHERGSVVSFVSRIENISPMLANRFLKEAYGGGYVEPKYGSIRQELEERWAQRRAEANPAMTKIPERFAAQAHAALPIEAQSYLEGRGFSALTIDSWQLGWDPFGDRVIIPARDEYHNLVGFKGRRLDGREPKYLVIGGKRYGFEPYETSRILFGLNRALAKSGFENIIIVEGELDCIAMHQKGHHNTVAVGGSSFSDEQRDILRRYAQRVTVFMDSDKGGNDGAARIIRSLEMFMPVHVVGDHQGDPAEMTPDAIQNALNDAISSVMLGVL